jgi:hypothetical protein
MPGASDYAAFFVDPASGTGGYWGTTNENGTSGVLALRVRVSGGRISEIEAIDVREEAQGPRGGTVTLMRPALPVELKFSSLGALDAVFQKPGNGGIPETLVGSYFDAFEKHSGKDVKFTAECTRRDNAVQRNTGCAAQMDPDRISPIFNKYQPHETGAFWWQMRNKEWC